MTMQSIQCLRCGAVYGQPQPCCSNCGHQFGQSLQPAATEVEHGVNGWAVAGLLLNLVPLVIGKLAPGSPLAILVIIAAFVVSVISYDWAMKHGRVGMSMAAVALLLSIGWGCLIVWVVANHSPLQHFLH